MNYYIIAGEPSGDLHGARLMEALAHEDQQANFRIWGGDAMANKPNTTLVKHIRDTAFMGVAEVARNIGTISRNMKLCKAELVAHRPDVLILIDYPGFNLRMAKFAKSKGIKVFYYISPKFWAWKEYRVERVKKYVDKMFLIFPFEVDFYAKHNYPADYVGNPLWDSIEARRANFGTEEVFRRHNQLGNKPLIAILPGSRKQEITSILPYQLQAVKHFTDYTFVVAATSMFEAEFYKKIIGNVPAKIVVDQTYELLEYAKAGIITSGTATLEAGMFALPQVVCMRVNPITYYLVKMVIKVSYLSLVNLILNREAVRELIQAELNEKQLSSELRAILPEGEKHKSIVADYQKLREIMGGPGASEKAAKKMMEYLK